MINTWGDLRDKYTDYIFDGSKIFLASAKDIKAESYLDENVSDSNIMVALSDVQYMIIEKITGSCLMNQLKMLVCDNDIGCNCCGWYKELLDSYLFPVITYGVQAQLSSHLTFKERNQGIIRNNDSQHLQYPSLSDVKYIKTEFEEKRDFYITRAVKWLRCNCCHFCELCCCSTCCDCETAPFQHPFSLGLNFESVYDKRLGFTRKI